MKNSLFPLFPIPLMICGRNYEFSAEETAFLTGLEMRDNDGNCMSADDRVLDRPELADLRAFIDEQIAVYKEQLIRVKADNDIYVTQSWVNNSAPGDFHPKHRHPNSIISGVLFLDDNDDGDLPPIQFHRSFAMFPLEFEYEELNEFNSSGRSFDPAKGMLMLFPSLVEHDVGRNLTERMRSSLSFNTYVRGPVGGRNQLTEVEIG